MFGKGRDGLYSSKTPTRNDISISSIFISGELNTIEIIAASVNRNEKTKLSFILRFTLGHSLEAQGGSAQLLR